MALTVSVNDRQVLGRKRHHQIGVTFDSSYPTGGEAITAADCGLSVLDYIYAVGDSAGYVVQHDISAGKLIVFEAGADGAALDEVANTGDLSSVTAEMVAVGT